MNEWQTHSLGDIQVYYYDLPLTLQIFKIIVSNAESRKTSRFCKI